MSVLRSTSCHPRYDQCGRHALKWLYERAGIELDDDKYLMPHGAQRGAGEIPVRTSGHAAAARALDNSEEVVHEHHSYTEAGDLAEQMTNPFEEAGWPNDSSSEQKTQSYYHLFNIERWSK